jgi:hypothetical protein
MARFFRPTRVYGKFGVALFDDRGNEINMRDRGLDEPCPEGGRHDWLMLPKQEYQKQYLICLKCGERNHA